LNNVQINQQLPAALSQQQMRAAMNNQYANAMAMGDPRYSVKSGMSLGTGQWNQAGIDSARKMAEGVSDAYRQDLANQQYNANVGLQGQANQEGFTQALGGLQQQNNYANQMAALQRQQTAMNFATSLLGGLLN
jgi:hypothetical protein